MPVCMLFLVSSLPSKISRKLRYFFWVSRYVLTFGAFCLSLRPMITPSLMLHYGSICPSQPVKSLPLNRWTAFSLSGNLTICCADQSPVAAGLSAGASAATDCEANINEDTARHSVPQIRCMIGLQDNELLSSIFSHRL